MPANLKFCAPFKINIQIRELLSNLKKNGFWFFSTISKKEWIKKLKVSTLDIRIKQSGLKVSHSKVPSSELILISRTYLRIHNIRSIFLKLILFHFITQHTIFISVKISPLLSPSCQLNKFKRHYRCISCGLCKFFYYFKQFS